MRTMEADTRSHLKGTPPSFAYTINSQVSQEAEASRMNRVSRLTVGARSLRPKQTPLVVSTLNYRLILSLTTDP